jgi:hypothetical protein
MQYLSRKRNALLAVYAKLVSQGIENPSSKDVAVGMGMEGTKQDCVKIRTNIWRLKRENLWPYPHATPSKRPAPILSSDDMEIANNIASMVAGMSEKKVRTLMRRVMKLRQS